LEEAERLLRGSHYSVAWIARECGFTSSGYFIRVFKQHAKMTPQRYRLGLRPKKEGGR
jgi:AraC-like DNA-binding protein